MSLVLVRHAQSARNVAKKGNAFFLDDESRKVVQGIPDQHMPITDEGRRQAELTGVALRQEFFARPPGGESFADVVQRVYLFLGMLFRERAGQRVLIVTHGGTLRAFRYLLERWTHDEFLARWDAELVPNCAVTTYVFDAALGRLTLRTLNAVHWQAPDGRPG